ncbi:hypothetical protein [Nocardioides sp. YIM 152588]|uniref:hypothetical protein n=1 Tax=Nocardioides sp. YIM 152588 TaxID=3158259 RepID=UPI0032E4CF7A
MTDEPQRAPDDDWVVGDRVVYVPRYSFDASYHRGVIVQIEPAADGGATTYVVQAEPECGFGRVRLERSHLQRRW